MNNINIQENLIISILDIIQPIRLAARSSDYRKILLLELGWNLEEIDGFPTAQFTTILEQIEPLAFNLESLLQNPPTSLEGIKIPLTIIKQTFDFINVISDFVSNVNTLPSTILQEFLKLGKELTEYLVAKYLDVNQPVLFNVLSVLGIVTPFDLNDREPAVIPSGNNVDWIRSERVSYDIDLSKIGFLLSNPKQYLIDTFFPISGEINSNLEAKNFSDKFFPRLSRLLVVLGFHSAYGMNEEDNINFDPAVYNLLSRSLSVMYKPDTGIDFGASLVLAENVNNKFALFLNFTAGLNIHRRVEDWYVALDADANIEGLAITKNSVELPASLAGTNLLIEGRLQRLFSEDTKQLLGSTTGTRLTIGKVGVRAFIDIAGNGTNYGITLNVDELGLVISGSDGDGFISKIFSNGAEAKFNLGIGWDKLNGLHFNVAGGLEVFIPTHVQIGPLGLEGVTLSVKVNNGTISLNAGGSANLVIGPLTATVENVGLSAKVTFPTTGGNLGLLNLAPGFKAPTGVGISIDSPTVTGGGFLAYDEDKATYTGALEIEFAKVSLKAIGILTTKLPGGQSGYSLLMLITAQGFTPIQLGLGFTLNGVGGLLALNRTIDEKALQSGIYNNTLESVLFPQNIVQNANTIISDLNKVFPIKEGRFVVGPMARIGWGTPTLLTIDLGIFIEMPAPVRLLLLGVLKASLPDEKKPILKLQVNFIGIIDFDKKKLSFDATLYNSKILTFALAGDMAVRLFWGDRPRFLITAGGFHPKFEPPPMELPNLRRLSISLVNTDNLRINAEAYYAITSNSAQFGASVNLWAKAWKATAEGKVWMDVLFKFSPFYFSADMGAHFAIKWNGKNKFSAQLTLKVEGPNPWRVQGEASFEICWIDVTIRFNKTFGQASTEVVAAVSLWPKVEAAVNHKDNWIVEGPERIQPMVTYREVPVTDTELLIDPFGGLRFSQKVVPLNVTLQKSGSAAINDYVRFSIGQITSTPTPGNTITLPTVSTRDYFARNEFFFMTEDEKLSRESYELNESGVRIGNTDELFSDFFTLRVISYEETFIDLRYRYWRFGGLFLTPERMRLHTYGDYISRSDLSNFRDVTPLGGPAKVNLSAAENTFVLANRNSLTAVSSDTYLNFQQAEEELVLLQSSNPAAAADYIIVNAFEL